MGRARCGNERTKKAGYWTRVREQPTVLVEHRRFRGQQVNADLGIELFCGARGAVLLRPAPVRPRIAQSIASSSTWPCVTSWHPVITPGGAARRLPVIVRAALVATHARVIVVREEVVAICLTSSIVGIDCLLARSGRKSRCRGWRKEEEHIQSDRTSEQSDAPCCQHYFPPVAVYCSASPGRLTASTFDTSTATGPV